MRRLRYAGMAGKGMILNRKKMWGYRPEPAAGRSGGEPAEKRLQRFGFRGFCLLFI